MLTPTRSDRRSTARQDPDVEPSLSRTVARNHHQVSDDSCVLLTSTEINPVASSYCLVIVLAISLFFMLRNENLRRERLQLDEKEAERTAFDDLTDKKNPHFRYVY